MKKTTHKKPHLTLIGAGPGDPELISLKGINALARADVILYDALVSPELLQHARPGTQKIFVGKRKGSHAYTQDQINKLIVDYAFQYGHVVRLKGGDPFVFGRGHEEISFVSSFGIDASIIPGISSAVALPGLQSIPLTKRGINESFWVITGTVSSGALSRDIVLAARTNATLVILMGIHQLKKIIAIYEEAGKAETAIAIIQNGSLPKEKSAVGTIRTIAREAEKKQIGAPAIIVIGEVVKLHPEFARSASERIDEKQYLQV